MEPKLNLGITAPGETLVAAIGQVVVAALNYASTIRSTMSVENRNELDALNNKLYRRFVELVVPGGQA